MQPPKPLEIDFSGERLDIVACEGAASSLLEALELVPAQHVKACWAQFVARRNMLATTASLRAPEFFSDEGSTSNGKDAKKFHAIKTRQGLRAYGWFSSRVPRTFFISHFVLKKWEKLRPADTDRVRANWKRIETGGAKK